MVGVLLAPLLVFLLLMGCGQVTFHSRRGKCACRGGYRLFVKGGGGGGGVELACMSILHFFGKKREQTDIVRAQSNKFQS